MRQYLPFLILSLWLGFAPSVHASPVDTFEFQDEVTRVRFQQLTKELRCPKCQNQDLADSNSPVAADLRKKIYELLQQGKSDAEIMNYMVERYGEFVLYRPRVNQLTYILWFAPIAFVFAGLVVVIALVRRKKLSHKATELSDDEQQKLQSIIKKHQ